MLLSPNRSDELEVRGLMGGRTKENKRKHKVKIGTFVFTFCMLILAGGSSTAL